MSLVGTKLSNLVPTDANVVKTETTEYPGVTILKEFLDVDGDGGPEVVRTTDKDSTGRTLGTWYTSNQLGHQQDSFSDENGDGWIDTHSYEVHTPTTGGKRYAVEFFQHRDDNFDGRTDARLRMNGDYRGTMVSWGLQDVDHDGVFDTETTTIYEAGDILSQSTRHVSIDVSTFE